MSTPTRLTVDAICEGAAVDPEDDRAEGVVAAALVAGGYHGLCADGGECACTADDLAPCGEMGDTCIAGYVTPCSGDCGEQHDWHIGTDRTFALAHSGSSLFDLQELAAKESAVIAEGLTS